MSGNHKAAGNYDDRSGGDQGCMPIVSVTIPCYNGEAFLAEAIQSVLEQSYQDWEIIAINDGSKDQTAEIIRSFHDSRIRYYSQENRGLAATRIRSVELARGKYIALLDQDDLWLPTKLETQVAVMESRPEVALVYTDVSVINTRGQILWQYSERYPPHSGRVLHQMFLGDFISVPSAMFRSSVVEHVGSFRPGLDFCADYDLFLRIAGRYEFAFIPTPLTKYRMHADNATWKMKIERLQDEKARTLSDCLQRNPSLEDDLGKRVVRLRLAGFSCNRRQANLLHGQWRQSWSELGGGTAALRAAAAVYLKYVVAHLPRGLHLRLLEMLRARVERSDSSVT